MFGVVLFTVLIIIAIKHIVRQYREDNGTKY